MRMGLGAIFCLVFLVFLFVSAIRMRVLSPSFWKIAIEKGRVYEQLQTQVVNWRVQIEGSVKKQAGGKALPKEAAKSLAPLLAIDKLLTSERFQELIETNLDRLLTYFKEKDKPLVLYLPVTEWKLPVQAMGQPMLSKLSAQTPVEDFLPIMGMNPEKVKSTMEQLAQTKTYLGYLGIVWWGLLILMLCIGVEHFFLGEGLGKRIKGTAWMMAIAGLFAKLVGVGAEKIFGMIATGAKTPLPPWGVALGESLVGQFFSLGATIGLGVGLVGLAIALAASWLVDN